MDKSNEMKKNEATEVSQIDTLFERISGLIEQARRFVTNSVNVAEVRTRFEVGRYIFESEQQGTRAEYGKQVLKNLSVRLIERFGSGWSYDMLKRCRFFYQAYGNAAFGATALPQLENDADNDECAEQQWSVKQLERQGGSSLYERLALSRNKDEVMRLAREGQTVEKPSDIIKNPLTLEFLGLKPDVAYTESKLENAIIDKMQQFLLELGKGFLFEARQKRFTFEERHFYVDLVFYNRLLQCYVLIDLKTGDLTHEDLGQMQMYVNYYDRHVKEDFEKPTIGILLCEEKSDALVELTLPKDANIYASQYSLYLPEKDLLQRKLKEWIDEFNENRIEN